MDVEDDIVVMVGFFLCHQSCPPLVLDDGHAIAAVDFFHPHLDPFVQ